MGIKKKFLTVIHWRRFSRLVGNAAFLQTFKVRLDQALRNMIWLKMFLIISVLELDHL